MSKLGNLWNIKKNIFFYKYKKEWIIFRNSKYISKTIDVNLSLPCMHFPYVWIQVDNIIVM